MLESKPLLVELLVIPVAQITADTSTAQVVQGKVCSAFAVEEEEVAGRFRLGAWVKLGDMGSTGEELPKAAVQEAKAQDRSEIF